MAVRGATASDLQRSCGGSVPSQPAVHAVLRAQNSEASSTVPTALDPSKRKAPQPCTKEFETARNHDPSDGRDNRSLLGYSHRM